jgi:1-deoxy-D-xylulose 5-phosphate reductoisomerase
VAAFLDGIIKFDEIPRVIHNVLEETRTQHPESIKEVLGVDCNARQHASEQVERLKSRKVGARRPVVAK